MWRDPLDDLIEDLERAVPTEKSSSFGPTPAENDAHLTDLQTVVSAIIYSRSDADLEADQQYQEARRRLDAFIDKYGRIYASFV